MGDLYLRFKTITSIIGYLVFQQVCCVATFRQHVSTGLTSPITGFEPYRMNTDIKMRDMQKDGKGRPVMVLNAEVG